MRRLAAAVLASLGGGVIMVLEVIGARYLAKDFGGSFYVWVSQIGIILLALAVGYYLGGALADRFQRLGLLAFLLLPAGVFTFAVPVLAPPVVAAIIERHPAQQAIPLVWQKLDPALGSLAVFFLPCLVLATLPPYLIRWATPQLSQVGRASGVVIASSTLGSIAGVFVAGYFLIDWMKVSAIFRLMGALTILAGVMALALDHWFRAPRVPGQPRPAL
jgi:MFS family permease